MYYSIIYINYYVIKKLKNIEFLVKYYVPCMSIESVINDIIVVN